MLTIYDVACKIFPFGLTVLLGEERGRGGERVFRLRDKERTAGSGFSVDGIKRGRQTYSLYDGEGFCFAKVNRLWSEGATYTRLCRRKKRGRRGKTDRISEGSTLFARFRGGE